MSFYNNSLRQWHQQNPMVRNASAGPTHSDMNNINVNQLQQQEYASASNVSKFPRKRRDDTNSIIEQLYSATRVHRPGEIEQVRVGARKNKNEIFGLINARLVKSKHLNGPKYARDVELARGIPMHSIHNDFAMILRTDGRIVAITDAIEQFVGKSMRALYSQCINIFECLDDIDAGKLRSILNSALFDTIDSPEYRLVCKLRFPKGKRPSRTREDIKTIAMSGHFYNCGNASGERLFVACCEALVSRTSSNGTNASQSAHNNGSNTTLTFSLDENMTIAAITADSNVSNLLGYTKNEMVGTWIGRYLPIKDLETFESIRQSHLRGGQQPVSICCILDMHANHGDGRLTFLCQVRSVRERRTKPIKFTVVAQLIDPSLRNDYVAYVRVENEQDFTKDRQVNQAKKGTSTAKSSDDIVVADSPSMAMGLLRYENVNYDFGHQTSPFVRSLSDVVEPFIFVDDQQQQWPFDDFVAPFNDHIKRCRLLSVEDFDEIDRILAINQHEQELARIDELLNEF